MAARKEPQTTEEWQNAVDAAHACLVVDAARMYGLVTGGPKVDLERCVDIIERGKAKGITPRPGVAEALALQWSRDSVRCGGAPMRSKYGEG